MDGYTHWEITWEACTAAGLRQEQADEVVGAAAWADDWNPLGRVHHLPPDARAVRWANRVVEALLDARKRFMKGDKTCWKLLGDALHYAQDACVSGTWALEAHRAIEAACRRCSNSNLLDASLEPKVGAISQPGLTVRLRQVQQAALSLWSTGTATQAARYALRHATSLSSWIIKCVVDHPHPPETRRSLAALAAERKRAVTDQLLRQLSAQARGG